MLRRSRLFRDYENVFTKATGLPLALRPLEYWQLEHHLKTKREPVLRPARATVQNVGRLFAVTRRDCSTYWHEGLHRDLPVRG